jgi:hypothetical protein
MPTVADDDRIDPQCKTLLGAFPTGAQPDVADRNEPLAQINAPRAASLSASTWSPAGAGWWAPSPAPS